MSNDQQDPLNMDEVHADLQRQWSVSDEEFWGETRKAYRKRRRQRTKDGLVFVWKYYRVPFIAVVAGILGGILVVIQTVVQLVT